MANDVEGLVERLGKRTKRTLPRDWQKGRDCPQCESSADRPKCMWEMGGACPRHDPDNYEPSPYVTGPDPDCHEAATTITALQADNERLRALLREAREDLELAAPVPIPDPHILVELRELCERAGYGNVMASASAIWRERLGDLAGGEFVCGPCRGTVEHGIARIDKELNHEDR